MGQVFAINILWPKYFEVVYSHLIEIILLSEIVNIDLLLLHVLRDERKAGKHVKDIPACRGTWNLGKHRNQCTSVATIIAIRSHPSNCKRQKKIHRSRLL
jgi:hypothetical protein